MEKLLLKNEEDKVSWENSLPTPLYGGLQPDFKPDHYPVIVVWEFDTNEWDSKTWIHYEYVYPEDFTG